MKIDLSLLSFLSRVRFFLSATLLAFLPASGMAQKAEIALPSLQIHANQMIAVPITVSTDSLLAFAQFVVEFDPVVLRFDCAVETLCSLKIQANFAL